MPLVQILAILIVVGLLLWLVNRLVAMQEPIKSILNVVVVISGGAVASEHIWTSSFALRHAFWNPIAAPEISSEGARNQRDGGNIHETGWTY
jgi:hypothetical protein